MSRARPNILLVIADDMGVHQLGCHGSAFYETPHLDRLAAEGVRFCRAYSTSPVCSPARAALYTGIHPARWHLTNFIPGTVPQLLNPPPGCRFAARCRFATDACTAAEPRLREVSPGHKVACIL